MSDAAKLINNIASFSVDSEERTIQSTVSSDIYGEVLPDAWGSIDELDSNLKVAFFT